MQVQLDERELATILEALRRHQQALPEAAGAEVGALCARLDQEQQPALKITDWICCAELASEEGLETTAGLLSLLEDMATDWEDQHPADAVVPAEDGRYYKAAVEVRLVEAGVPYVRWLLQQELGRIGEEDAGRAERLRACLAQLPQAAR